MTIPSPVGPTADSVWVRFWHAPVRAERLGLMRILLATALLADELFQYLPNFAEFFGPEGDGPADLYDSYQLQDWHVSYFFFGTDNLYVLYPLLGLWIAVTIAFLVGWQTRPMNLLVWFLTRCFLERHPNIIYGGDDVLQVGLFLLMFAPSGAALSVDAWRKRRKGHLQGPALVPPWSLRILQIQMCLIYCSSGLAKLRGETWGQGDTWAEWFTGSWWDGTAIHYFLNDTSMARRSYAEYPVPFLMTMTMTYAVVWWEALFPLLVVSRRTRPVALAFGVIFHIGIWLSVAIDWFVFYTLAFYAIWIPDSFWRRVDTWLTPPKTAAPTATAERGAPPV